MASMLDFALRYLEIFHAIVPVGCWTYTDKDGKEKNAWKSPLIKNWTQDPLGTEARVRSVWNWWHCQYGRIPNIGVVTGQICGGYIVIDLDNKPEKGVNGWEELQSWQRREGLILPEETWTAITGSGGYHLWYRTNRAMRPYENVDFGIDLRADGAQVVVPPSIHRNGKRYEWEISPGDCECAEANEAVYRFIDEYRPADYQYRNSTFRGTGGERKMALPPEIPDGGRHTALVSLIGTLNRLGASDEAIIAAVRIENEQKCNPPLTEEELQKEVFPAVFRWEKGESADRWQKREDFLKELKAKSFLEKRKMIVAE